MCDGKRANVREREINRKRERELDADKLPKMLAFNQIDADIWYSLIIYIKLCFTCGTKNCARLIGNANEIAIDTIRNSNI